MSSISSQADRHDTTARIVLTPGEPAGIGPDLAVQLAQRPQTCEVICVADPQLLAQRARALKLPLHLREIDFDKPPAVSQACELAVHALDLADTVVPGRLNVANAPYVLDTLRFAGQACRDGLADALVTGPVHKGIINDAGVTFSGHTEFLAELTGAQPVMLLVAGELRVALLTTHLPLREVPQAITQHRLRQVLLILEHDLRTRFGITRPRIAVCGVNPHAGEGGHLGDEEIRVLQPALAQLREQGLIVNGPLPADTAFTPRQLEECDAVLAMYHDQGLPVLKHAGFGNAVNVTLGLPIVRTSVDHGTALALAGTGDAQVESMAAALTLALELSRRPYRPRA
ncbi:MAG: 4-hydroxythreonine-4-phosphate dehydrogenase PdxA [Gammaproteobacteria bacterium]|nr:4-hydroxythreonine-4-phosphate dehydrogenase PdxA [Gammaproteobacteria bacterium]